MLVVSVIVLYGRGIDRYIIRYRPIALGFYCSRSLDLLRELLDLIEKKCLWEESKSSLQLQIHDVQLEKQDLQDRFKVMEQQNTELLR